jgi:hypothetical protein
MNCLMKCSFVIGIALGLLFVAIPDTSRGQPTYTCSGSSPCPNLIGQGFSLYSPDCTGSGNGCVTNGTGGPITYCLPSGSGCTLTKPQKCPGKCTNGGNCNVTFTGC